MLDRHFPLTEPPPPCKETGNDTGGGGGGGGGEGPTTIAETSEAPSKATDVAVLEYMKSLYTKSTISALRALKEIRSKSSTVSVFSLPPLQVSGIEETWNKLPLHEQLAK